MDTMNLQPLSPKIYHPSRPQGVTLGTECLLEAFVSGVQAPKLRERARTLGRQLTMEIEKLSDADIRTVVDLKVWMQGEANGDSQRAPLTVDLNTTLHPRDYRHPPIALNVLFAPTFHP